MRSVPATICRRSSCLHTTSSHRGAGTSPSFGSPPGLHSARHSLAALYQNRSVLYLGAAGSAPHGAPHTGSACRRRLFQGMSATGVHTAQGRLQHTIHWAQHNRIAGPSAKQTGKSDGSDGPGGPCAADPKCLVPRPLSAPPPAAVARWCRRCAAAVAATGSASSRRWCGWPGR